VPGGAQHVLIELLLFCCILCCLVLLLQLRRHPQLPRDVESLAALSLAAPGSAQHVPTLSASMLRALLLQLRRYPQLPRDVESLAALCSVPGRAQDITGDGKFQWRGDIPIVAFGKYTGESSRNHRQAIAASKQILANNMHAGLLLVAVGSYTLAITGDGKS
jgi:hypothetical protein